MGGETRRAKSLRIGVHHANGVVWGPLYRTHLMSSVPVDLAAAKRWSIPPRFSRVARSSAAGEGPWRLRAGGGSTAYGSLARTPARPKLIAASAPRARRRLTCRLDACELCSPERLYFHDLIVAASRRVARRPPRARAMALRPVQRIKNRPVTTKLCLCVLLSIFSFTLYRHETSRARAIADAGVGVAAARAAATTAGSARGGASARARAIAALVKAHGVERVEETIAATRASGDGDDAGADDDDAKTTTAKTATPTNATRRVPAAVAVEKTETPSIERAPLAGRTRFVDPLNAVSTPSPARIRACGSPASDAYSSVNASCLLSSPTATSFDATPSARRALIAWIEPRASYDGLAVRWGLGHTVQSAEACAEACREHEPGKAGAEVASLPCNAFAYCPMETPRAQNLNDTMKPKGGGKGDHGGCFEPDAHEHAPGDCWLKFTEAPEAVEVNQARRVYAGFHTTPSAW